MKSTNLDLLLEEHNLGEQIGEKYFLICILLFNLHLFFMED